MFPSFRRTLPAALIAGAAVAGPVAGAQASNASLRATFNHAAPRLSRDEAAVVKALQAYRPAHATASIRALRREVSDIHALGGQIAAQPASSANGRTGKADVTRGLSTVAGAYGALAGDLQKLGRGQRVSNRTIQATARAGQRGRAELVQGLKLLK